jgi:tricorn protease-like protein
LIKYTDFAFPLRVETTIQLIGFEQSVWSLAWSADGKGLAIAGAQTITVRDAESGKIRKVLAPASGGENSLFFMPDNNKVLAPAKPSPDALSIWDISRGQVDRNIPSPFPDDKYRNVTYWVSMSKDGSIAASTTLSGDYVAVYSLKDGKVIRKWVLGDPREFRRIGAIALSPDGKYLAVIKNIEDNISKEISILNISTGLESLSITGVCGTTNALAFSPDSQFIASSATHANQNGRSLADPGHSVTVWNVSDGKVKATYPDAETGEISQIAWLPDSKSMAFVEPGNQLTDSNTVRLWSIDKPDETGPILKFSPMVYIKFSIPVVAVSPDGKKLAVALDSKLKIFDLPDKTVR